VSGLGLVGIVLEATFECVLAFDLETTLSTMRFDDVIDNIDHLEVAARLDDKTNFVDSRSKKLFTNELLELGNAVSAAKLDCSR
jgi:hypothetical protein